MAPPKKKIKLSKKEKKIKLSKLRSFRHERNYDETYVNTFNTIHNQFDRISESSVNYETGVKFGLLIFRLTFLKPSSIYIFNMLKCVFILDYIIGNENTTK